MSESEMRKLDAFLAKHVMGWREASTITDLDSGPTPSFYLYQKCHAIDFRQGNHRGQFHPTTDPAAAMEVESKIAERFGPIRITRCKDGWMSSCRDENGGGETRTIASCKLAKTLFK